MAEFAYTRVRSQYGRQPAFTDIAVDVQINIRPTDGELKNFIRRNPVDRETSFTEDISEHYVSISFC